MIRTAGHARRATPVLAALALAACASAPRPVPVTPAPVAQPVARMRGVPESIRWFRTSAERRVLYVQVYRAAGEQLARLAAGRPAGSWAVILDADETVLDNSPYQRERALLDSGFTPQSWDAWVRRASAEPLPGAVAFTRRAHELGGRVAIVTNRDEAQCPPTRDNLRAVGVAADVVLCKPAEGSGDKNPRFQAVAAGTAAAGVPPLQVLMWVGDNIQDFPGLSQDIRFAEESALAEFGVKYFLLPNPMYGSWERNQER
jgi:5'-nucleotidase (lipoprotein e(P4) family)